MTPEWIYLLKVNVGITLFYIFYKLFCQRDTFFQWRRFSLLGFLIFSLLYPLFNIQHWVMEQPVIYEMADYYTDWISNETVVDKMEISATPISTTELPDLMTILTYLYFSGIFVLGIRFIVQLISICRMRWKGTAIYLNGQRIISLPFEANPFSFFGWIFLYLPKLDEKTQHEILIHEQTHVRQCHSVDRVFSEIIHIICWFNPFSWLLKSEIRLNLEFLADHQVTETIKDNKSYQRHLLEFTYIGSRIGFCNNFNVSPLKVRIIMMNRKRTHTMAYLKYGFFVPLTAALFLFSNINCTLMDEELSIEKEEIKEVDLSQAEEESFEHKEMVLAKELVKEEGTSQPMEEIIENEENISAEKQTKEEKFPQIVEAPLLFKKDIPINKINRIPVIKEQAKEEESSEIGEYEENLLTETRMKKNSLTNNQTDIPLFFMYLLKNIEHISEFIKEGIQGEVKIEAIMRKNGELTDIKLVQGVHPLLDNEVLRVMNDMPKGLYYKHKFKSDPKINIPILFEIIDNRVKISIPKQIKINK